MHLKIGDLDSDKYDVIDLDTGIAIPGVQEADDVTGEFSLFLFDYFTSRQILKNIDEVAIFKFKGNIKLVKKED